MRILVVGTNVPTKEAPMNGLFEFNQAMALARAGHEVVYLAVDTRSLRHRRPLWIQHRVDGPLHSYKASLPIGKVPYAIRKWASYSVLRLLSEYAYRQRERPEVVHSHFLKVGASVDILSRRLKIPHVHTEHFSALMKRPLARDIHTIAESFYSRVDQIITVSPALQSNLRSQLGVDSDVIPNIVDTAEFAYKPTPSGGFRIATVGNLHAGKGMDITLRAFCRLARDHGDVSLSIVGDGPERERLESLAFDLGVSEMVEFCGLRDRSYIARLFNSSDLFVLASKSETFGVVYLEALASGLPVIGTRCGGPEHFLDEFGILVEVDDVDALSVAMENVYRGVYVFDAQTTAADVRWTFGEKNVTDRLVAVYERLAV